MKKETILNILLFSILSLSFSYKGGAFYLSKILTVLILSFFLFIIILKSKKPLHPFPVFGISIFLFNLVFTISLFHSICKINTLHYIIWFFLYSILFFFIFKYNEKIFDFSIKLIITSAFILSAYGLLQYFGAISKFYWGNTKFLSSTFVNHTHFANILTMAIPIYFAYFLLNGKSILNKIIHFLFTATFLTAFALAQSRIAFASLLTSVLLFLLLSFASNSYYKNKIFLTTFIVLLILSTLIFFNKNSKRFNAKTINKDKSFKVRKEIAIDTIKMIKIQNHPVGAGNFSFGFQKYKSQNLYQFRIHYAYNEILQLIAENGYAVLIPLFFFLYSLFKSKITTLRNNYPVTAVYHNAFFSSICANLIQSLFDFNFHIPANFTLFFIILGLYAGKTKKLWEK